ncbi:MAG: hypothetical protein U0324_22435 [Polyangiales bacterium]
MLARTTLALAALVAACAARAARAPHPAPAVAPPPVAPPARTALVVESLTPAQLHDAWRAKAPAGRTAIEAALIVRLRAETERRVYPGSGFVNAQALAQADAIVAEVAPEARPALARAMLAWLIERGWSFGEARATLRHLTAALGEEAYDTVAAASDREAVAYGVPGIVVHSDDVGRDALRARLRPRTLAAFDAARAGVAAGERVDPGDPPHERLARLLRLLEALDRPEPVHRFLLDRLADAALPTTLRVAALNGMTRSNLPFVAPALLAVAARPGDEEVRLRVIERLGAMVDEVTSAQLASLYERTPQGEAGASFRGRVGFELIRRGWPAARAAVLRWARRSGAMRVGRVEAETWSRAFAGCAPVPDVLWRDPAPEVRALAVLAWSWTHARSDAARVQALANDRAPLTMPGWGPTVGAAARAALAGRALDPSIEHACCCFGQ